MRVNFVPQRFHSRCQPCGFFASLNFKGFARDWRSPVMFQALAVRFPAKSLSPCQSPIASSLFTL
jgi:hypothetical protein